MVRTGPDTLNGSPADISEIEDRQTDVVLMIGDLQVFLQANDLGISNICTVEEGAEE
jgi:hypothetical protein